MNQKVGRLFKKTDHQDPGFLRRATLALAGNGLPDFNVAMYDLKLIN